MEARVCKFSLDLRRCEARRSWFQKQSEESERATARTRDSLLELFLLGVGGDVGVVNVGGKLSLGGVLAVPLAIALCAASRHNLSRLASVASILDPLGALVQGVLVLIVDVVVLRSAFLPREARGERGERRGGSACDGMGTSNPELTRKA